MMRCGVFSLQSSLRERKEGAVLVETLGLDVADGEESRDGRVPGRENGPGT